MNIKKFVEERNNAVIACWNSYEKNGKEGIDFTQLDEYVNKWCDLRVKIDWSKTTYYVKCLTLCEMTENITTKEVNQWQNAAKDLRTFVRMMVNNKLC